jgi:hypothetical protein
MLTRDFRYKLHLVAFRHLQTAWTLFSTLGCVLMAALALAEITVLATIGTCLVWLLLQVAGLSACKVARRQVS